MSTHYPPAMLRVRVLAENDRGATQLALKSAQNPPSWPTVTLNDKNLPKNKSYCRRLFQQF